MSDLISRQEAIDALKRAEALTRAFGYHNVIETIRDLPSVQPEPQWIPCSERLPEYNQICIVTDETRRYTYEYDFHDETYDDESGWTYMGHKIIAWMPLPEPYCGERMEKS